MEKIAKAYLSNRECSIQETAYHILPELKLRRIFWPFILLTKILQRKESEKQLNELPGDSPNILKKYKVDRYMERPRPTFCNGKYSILDYFCYAEFLVYYTLKNKSSKTGECEPDEVDNNFIDNYHEECPYPPKLN